MILRTIILLLLTLHLNGQDSLFLNSEFGATHEDNPCTLGTQIKTKKGNILAIKFYKPEASAAAYTISVWSSSTTKIFSQDYRSTTTGWQRIPVSIPVNDGVYTIIVYNPVGRYNYRKTTFPISKGSITGQAGKFGYTTGFPLNSSSTTYFIDAVIGSAPVVPLSVKVLPETRIVDFTTSKMILTGNITGSYKSFNWEILEQQGNFVLSDTTTLTPSFRCTDSSGCSIRLMLTATDANGFQQAEFGDIYIKPSDDQVIMIGTRGGRFFYIRNVIILD